MKETMLESGKRSLRKKGVKWQGATSATLQYSWQWLLKDLGSGFWPLFSDLPPWSHDQHTESKWPSYSTFVPLPAIFLIATKAGKCHPDPKGTLPFHRSYPLPITLKWTLTVSPNFHIFLPSSPLCLRQHHSLQQMCWSSSPHLWIATKPHLTHPFRSRSVSNLPHHLS